MKTKLLRGLLVVLLGYLLLVAAYFIYLETGGRPLPEGLGTTLGLQAERRWSSYEVALPRADFSVRNYASELRLQGGASDHKYEKVGALQATTVRFESDEKAARKAINGFRGILQEEALAGVVGTRTLALTIGVPPGEFDTAVAALRQIGETRSFSVTKTDKTNDYLQLRAKSTSLIKTRDALIALKGVGGKIEELVKLEREILDLETKIQELGVQLGVFDQVNELCTVRFNLAEQVAEPEGHPHAARLLASLSWASGVYLSLLVALVLGLLGLVLALVVAQKCKAILAGPDQK